jgi:ABC-type transporter MlaC component
MKLKNLLLGMFLLVGMTTFTMATAVQNNETVMVQETEDTWFGDAYEEDGCYCN